MKKLFSTIKKVVLTVGLLVAGYVGGNMVTETPAAETSNNICNGINQIENDERNVFSQYFTITGLDDEGADVVNRFNPNDNYYIDKQDFNLDFDTLEIGEPIVVTFDHDTTIDAIRDLSLVHQYELEDSDNIDNSKYILGVSTTHTNETVILERDNLREGDTVNVTFKDDTHDNIHSVVKVGHYNEYIK